MKDGIKDDEWGRHEKIEGKKNCVYLRKNCVILKMYLAHLKLKII